ncbi:MAG TPA: HAD-IC family P-type ATPase [Gemmataceae bacterium]|jgi:calcium-translocating P-type ATPase
MSVKPHILSSIPGRIRIHLPHWLGNGQRRLEQRIRKLPGVRRVEANSLTGNVLIGFDPHATNENALVAALGTPEAETNGHLEDKPLPPVISEGISGSLHQARIAVRGLDRDPRLTGRVLEQLRNLFGVRVRASQLTGRILVEYDANQVDLHEVLARVADVELPDLPGEDRPEHPLDRAPLFHAAARTIGAAFGLGLIVVRRLAGRTAPLRQVKIATTTAGLLGLARSFPSIRNGLRQVLGIHAADLFFSTTSVATLALAGSPLGLTVTGLEGLLLLTEVMARRSAWRRYEDSLQGTASAEPGAVIRMEAEERLPLPAEVIEGTGTAIGRDGLPRQIAPGAHLSAGAELSGGPFVVHLEGGKSFAPRPRPAPPRPKLYNRYARILGPLSLGYAAATAVLTRSLGRTFEALLLVNPRPAIIAMEAANLDAAARVLRAGVTVVGTRPDRAIRLPDVLLLDGPRVLTDGLEVTTVLPLDESLNESQVLALAGSMSVAAGSPWGNIFPSTDKKAKGAFNGLWISASVEGQSYILGPPDDPPAVGEAIERRAEGGYLLMLAREEDGHALGLVALRPCRSVEGTPASGGVRGDGLEITTVLPMDDSLDTSGVLTLAASVSAAAGSPWGNVFTATNETPGADGIFNGLWASAAVEGVRYTLGPPEDTPTIGEAVERQHEGGYLLMLSREEDWRPLGFVTLRPRLQPSVQRLVQTCRRLGVRLEMLSAGAPVAAQAVARRAGVKLVNSADAVDVMGEHQQNGEVVAFVSDSAQAAPGFADCDLGIGLAPSPAGQFPARADLLALDLDAVAAVIEAGARRERAVRDGVWFSAVANIFGAVWGVRGRPGIERASHAVYVSALVALADGWLRMRGGQRPDSSVSRLVDPHPERWGRRSIASVLRALKASEDGLSTQQAKQRREMVPLAMSRQALMKAVLDQMRSPVNGILTSGALLSLIAGGAALDIVIIGATVAINVTVAVWQERQAGKAVEALRRLGTTTARVLRDGTLKTIPASEAVPGDILLLAPGDRVAADARLLSAHSLEVDEAALTGESVPVAKHAESGPPEGRVVMEGSGVVVGTGRAVVVAVGRKTRLGATAAALSQDEMEESPFGARLARLLQMALPIAAAGGATVIASGILWGKPLVSQISVGASIALAVVPESLPLLAGTGQVGVARRLATRRALLRNLPAVEALGRVDVACTDKTGTLTEGRLAVRLVAAADHEANLPGELDSELRRVLRTAALASPHPEAADAVSHPTDVAVIAAARSAGLGDDLSQPHQREAPFDPDRSYHAAFVGGRLRVKGAPEAVCPRCTRLRRAESDQPLNDAGQQALLEQAQAFSARGLRILMIADGPPDASVDDPQGLRALGFIGISDPLRPNVHAAVRRCREAGVRVIMITGDHPATARAIAREAGLLDGGDVLTGTELAELDNEELDRRMENATVIARATPLDKLRIIESLRRRGHTVAMTGDGVNDAPALRLADVGVAMGRGGTEVARQAADVVLADDDFATLVEALVEGRGFWRNMRRALGLLLGGNLGELGLIVGTTALGFTSPLNTRQILAVNLITDALPALSVVLQQPEHRNLAALAREGTAALDDSLRRDVFRRGAATTLPTLAAYLLSRSNSTVPQAGAVAFGTIVATQLAQTLDAGWSEGNLNLPVLGAVGGSAAFLVSTLTLSPLRNLLGLAVPSAPGWLLIGGGALAAVALNRVLAAGSGWVAKSKPNEPEALVTDAPPSLTLPARLLLR